MAISVRLMPSFTVADNQGARSQPATVQVSVTAANSGGSGSSGTGSSGSGDAGGKSGGGGPFGTLEIDLLIAVALVRAATPRRITRHCQYSVVTGDD